MIKKEIQIRFNDMDPMRRVNNASYSAYLEVARVAFCENFIEIKTLEDIPFVMVRVEMDLLQSVLPGDKVFVTIWVSKIGNTSWEFSYKIQSANAEITYVRAKSVQVYFNYHLGRKETIPDGFRKILESEFQSI
ncbi:MAG: thioesterase family protein [Leptospira sp.]|nr:thioesterase family protein [Leptospira sp.]